MKTPPGQGGVSICALDYLEVRPGATGPHPGFFLFGLFGFLLRLWWAIKAFVGSWPRGNGAASWFLSFGLFGFLLRLWWATRTSMGFLSCSTLEGNPTPN